MMTRIQKWGNSQGIRFPRQVLRQAHIRVGDSVDVTVHDGEIVVKPARIVRGKYTLDELLSGKATRDKEVDWGRPAGREVW